MICTKRRLNEEIERIKKILLGNGYPKNVINAPITRKINHDVEKKLHLSQHVGGALFLSGALIGMVS